jgi:hypothetical protein
MESDIRLRKTTTTGPKPRPIESKKLPPSEEEVSEMDLDSDSIQTRRNTVLVHSNFKIGF